MDQKQLFFSQMEQVVFSKLAFSMFFKKNFFVLIFSYPSGNLAISISEVARTMLLYTAFTDDPTTSAKQIAQFDPFGNGYSNFTNGDLRYKI
jgi:hypothetical protein